MIPVRLVLDTNILVSAALKPEGLQRTIVLLAITKPARLYVTKPVLEEYDEVLSRTKLMVRRSVREQLLAKIRNRSHLVRPSSLPDITSDPNDLKFLECADAARADYLITGNVRDFPLFWKNTKVVTTREFIGLIAPHLLG